ncbi:hypothetical protein HZU77_016635 [Neisseriaceae bacterium TC5R-5]|nr:hypothetical protein [Neisseriaceae bacterium TC5R-5]
MLLFLSDGKQIRGDLIKSAVLRYDLAPIPVTLEAEIRCGDGDMEQRLAEGECLSTGSGDVLRIIKAVIVLGGVVQGERELSGVRLTAILDACHSVAFVHQRAIIKENAALSVIYRAAGATLQGIAADFPVPRFCCPIGDTPSFHIARILQEEGGIVRWQAGQLQFVRLPDLFKQDPVTILPNHASDDIASGFLERHQVPWFLSLNAAGGFVLGNQNKPRTVRYVPFQNAQRLRNMTRCLVQRKVCKTGFNGELLAGDLVRFIGGEDLCVITAAHTFESGTDSGGASNTYTRLWLGRLEE